MFFKGGLGKASRMDRSLSESTDFRSLTLRIKVSMSPVYEFDAQYGGSRRQQPPKGRKAVGYPCSGLANALRRV
jgi:hypothetical protein